MPASIVPFREIERLRVLPCNDGFGDRKVIHVDFWKIRWLCTDLARGSNLSPSAPHKANALQRRRLPDTKVSAGKPPRL
jgi:hypothetical protein